MTMIMGGRPIPATAPPIGGMPQNPDDPTINPVGMDDPQNQQQVDPEDAGEGQEDDYTTLPAIDYENIVGYDGTGKLSKEDLKKVADDCYNLIFQSYNATSAVRKHIDEYRDIFEGKRALRGGPWPNSCKIQPPDVRSAVETVVARENESLFGAKARIRVTPDIHTDMDTAKKIEDWYTAGTAPSRLNLRSLMYPAQLTARVDGMQIGITDWKRTTRNVKKRMTVNAQLIALLNRRGKNVAPPTDPSIYPWVEIDGKSYRWNSQYIYEGEEVVENCFDLTFCNYQDFFMFPATSRSIEQAGLAGYFYGLTTSECLDRSRDGAFDEDAVKLLLTLNPRPMGTAGDSIESGALASEARTTFEDRTSDTVLPDIDRFAPMRFASFVYNGYDTDGDGYNDPMLVQMEMSTRIITAFRTNPFHNGVIPMRELRPEPRIGHVFRGYSLIEKLDELDKEIGALTRMGIDIATLSTIVYIAVEAGRKPVADMPARPGPNFIDNDIDGKIIDVHELPNLPNSNLANRSDVRDMIQRLSGADDTLQGVATTGMRTASETNTRVGSANIRMRMSLLSQLDFLTWVANQFRDYHMQFMEEAETFTVIRGGKRIEQTITLEDLAIPCRIEAYCADLDPDAALRQQFAEKIFTVLQQSPFAQSDLARVYQILVDFAEACGADYEMGPRIGTLEEAQTMQQQLAEQQAMMQAAQQGVQGPGGVPPQGPPPIGGGGQQPPGIPQPGGPYQVGGFGAGGPSK